MLLEESLKNSTLGRASLKEEPRSTSVTSMERKHICSQSAQILFTKRGIGNS